MFIFHHQPLRSLYYRHLSHLLQASHSLLFYFAIFSTMLLRTSRSSRNRNLSLILCCVGLTFVALHHKDVPRHIDGWKWHRASRIYGRDEEWPAGSFAAWQAKDDGKFFVPVDKDGLAVAWNDTATRDVPLKHPMHYLISDGERRWKRMLDRCVLRRDVLG